MFLSIGRSSPGLPGLQDRTLLALASRKHTDVAFLGDVSGPSSRTTRAIRQFLSL